MDDMIADLYYISGYAEEIRKELLKGQPPTIGWVIRMAELAEKVHRSLDPKLAAWCDSQEPNPA